MNIEILKENIVPHPSSKVCVKKMGNLTEIRYMTHLPNIHIKKLNKNNYIDLTTGEIRNFSHTQNRADNKESVAKSLARLREILNTNVTDARKALWITLTYAENMTDHNRLYQDFRKFNMRMQYYLKKQNLPLYEYVLVGEPQKRGAWHLHMVMIFQKKAPFIPNVILAEKWGHGFVKISSLENIDNVGLYLSAYLGDMDLSEMSLSEIKAIKSTIKEIETIDTNGKIRKKAIVKGARLKLYPVGFRLFRTSSKILKPEIIECCNAEALEMIKSAPLTYEKTIAIKNSDGETVNTINYRQFNRKRKSPINFR